MKEEKNNIKYSAEDIRKYLDGELSDSKMQALEKTALEDPFLADAIEGFEESRKHPVSFESDLAELQKKLALRIRDKNRKTGMIVLLSNWKIAASVIFILGLTIFTYKYIVSKNPAELATTTKKDSSRELPASLPAHEPVDTTGIESTQKSPDPISTEKENQALTDEEKIKPTERATGTAGKSKKFNKKEIQTPQVSLSRPVADSVDQTAKTSAPDRNEDLSSPSPKLVQVELDERVSGVAISKDKTLSENYIKGVVVDQKGKPIPFAAINFKGSKKDTFTDTAGFFKLYLKNPSLAALVFVHPSGYEPVSAELKPDSAYTNKIQLRAMEAISEQEEDEGYFSASKKKSGELTENAGRNNPEGVLGWENFKNYIKNNKKIITADSLLKGEEIISFLINPDGKLSSFKVEKTISSVHDAEILNLIRSAPVLKTKNGKKQRCYISIAFP